MASVRVAIHLPNELLERVDTLIPEKHRNRSQAVQRAIELYLYRLACERDAEIYERFPLTEDELLLADDPEAWSTLPPW